MCAKNRVSVPDIHLERRIRQRFENHAFYFDHVVFCQAYPSWSR